KLPVVAHADFLDNVGVIYGFHRRQPAHPHAKQPDAPLQRHALETFPRDMSDLLRVLRWRLDRLIARHRFEIVVAQLEPDRPAGVTLALQIVRYLGAKLGEDLRKLVAVVRGVQVALEGRLAAHAYRL